MQNLDPDNLFSIFEQGDEQVYQEHNLEEVLKNPYVLMGMVLRGLENFRLMDLMYARNYPKEYKAKRKYIKFKYYCKLYEYLDRIKWSKEEEIYKISNAYDLAETSQGLNDMLYYFEALECYEKCAIIKKCLDKLYDFSVKELEVTK